MFNILHPQRLVAVSSSSSQQICEEAIQVTGKNKKVKTVTIKLPVEREPSCSRSLPFLVEVQNENL